MTSPGNLGGRAPRDRDVLASMLDHYGRRARTGEEPLPLWIRVLLPTAIAAAAVLVLVVVGVL